MIWYTGLSGEKLPYERYRRGCAVIIGFGTNCVLWDPFFSIAYVGFKRNSGRRVFDLDRFGGLGLIGHYPRAQPQRGTQAMGDW